MIPTGSVTALMGLDAFAVCIVDDQDVTLARGLIAYRPALDFRAPRGGADNVRLRGERAFPGAFPVLGRHGRAAGNDQGQHD